MCRATGIIADGRIDLRPQRHTTLLQHLLVGQLAIGGTGDSGHHRHGLHRCLPIEVSADNMTAGASKMALATSVTSAR
jgi:hypothetical protein